MLSDEQRRAKLTDRIERVCVSHLLNHVDRSHITKAALESPTFMAMVEAADKSDSVLGRKVNLLTTLLNGVSLGILLCQSEHLPDDE
jgi:hypothetical protein